MDQSIIYFLLIFSGASLSVGLVNLTLGLQRGGNRLYLYFGLIGVFSSGYYFINVIDNGTSESHLLFVLAILSLMAAFVALPWFLGSYSGYQNKALKYGILVGMAVSFILLLLPDSNESPLYWNILAHLVVIEIIVFGFLSGFHLKKTNNKKSALMVLVMMFITSLLTIDDILLVHFSDYHPSILPSGLLPLDYFPILFMIVLGPKLASDIQQRYYLEKEINASEKRWSTLLQNIELLVVGLDIDGKINLANPYFLSQTGYTEEDIIGKDWFDQFLSETDDAKVRMVFHDHLMNGTYAHYKNPIRQRDNRKRMISWSNVNQYNSSGNVIGMITIGADITERENAYREVQQLKDQLERENILLKEGISYKTTSSEITGKSDAIRYVLQRSLQVAPTDSTVLLEGETGVGKELIANYIQQNSQRKGKPFIKINCAAIPATLLESELFGHTRGAFTGAERVKKGMVEMAHRGTLFLDEIGEFPMELQPKLLRFLQEGEYKSLGSESSNKVDVRIIAATNRELLTEIENGRFRNDLYYRLYVYPITLPPLRNRVEDIPELIDVFVNQYAKKHIKPIKKVSKLVVEELSKYAWPGNIRELENVLERAVIVCNTDTIKIKDLSPVIEKSKTRVEVKQDTLLTLEDAEREHIFKALEQSNWQVHGPAGAAMLLGINPSTLRSRMKKLDINRPL